MFLEHDIIPFQNSFSFDVGNTEFYESLSVLYWYGSGLEETVHVGPLVDHWQVCDLRKFPQIGQYGNWKNTTILTQPLKRSNCKHIDASDDSFLDLTYAMIHPGARTNGKLHKNAIISVFHNVRTTST